MQTRLVTLVEKRSEYLLAARLPTITAYRIGQGKDSVIGTMPRCTADHHLGKQVGIRRAPEGSQGRLGNDLFFCDPYHSFQRGTNENTKILIRQYFPKGTDFRKGE
jgi:transposase, IS30 family